MIDGKLYNCNEQYIQLSKATLFDDQAAAEKIMRCDNPHEIRALGRNISGFQYWVWKREVSALIKQCNQKKFSENAEAKEALLATGRKTIAEASRDTFWGCGVHITDSTCLDKQTWVGKNKMGKILMNIREELSKADADQSNAENVSHPALVNVIEEDRVTNNDLDNGAAGEGDSCTGVLTEVQREINGKKNDEENKYDAKMNSTEPGVNNENDALSQDDGSHDDSICMEIDNNVSSESEHEIDVSDDDSNVCSDLENEMNDPVSECKDTIDEITESLQATGKYVMIIGDSNCRNIMDNVPFHIDKQAIGGTAIFDVDTLIQESQIPADKVAAVILHVGTCDFDTARHNNVNMIYTEYVDCVYNIQSKYHEADIIISGVLPRAPRSGRSNKQVNDEIQELNQKLCALEKEVTNIMFADHSALFIEDGMVKQSLFRQADKTGVHINEKGVQVLNENLIKALVEIHFQKKLAVEYDVIPTLSLPS